MSARYWIAQHISDLFRNEPRNIGVFVELGERSSARFFGEAEAGQIDGRRLRNFRYPEVYKQWIEYWRSHVGTVSPASLVKTSGSHYRIIEGGVVDDVGNDPIEDVLNYLYALLVSEGGFAEVFRADEDAAEGMTLRLVDEVAHTFQLNGILGGTPGLFVPNPVQHNVPVPGQKIASHKPAFSQVNGQQYIMETVDFTVSRKQQPRDHAGWSAYMFRDICALNPNTESIAIVKFTDADLDNQYVENGLSLLRNEAEIVHWLEEDVREQFIAARKAIASAS